MSHPLVFGYGSLVNRATHTYADAHRATARGWRRAWRRTSLRPVSYLTVVPCSETEIEGMVAGVPPADWSDLDHRERAYERLTLAEVDVRHEAGPDRLTAIYAIPNGSHDAPGPENPILLSYIDVVLQGYLSEFGEEGVAKFVSTTDGWEAPILDDRSEPRYGRAQSLTPEETALVDEWLRRLFAVVTKPE